MKAEESKIIDILTENKRYIIPSYQRPYSWTRDHVEKFINDIYESFEEGRSEYFIGSLICIDKGEEVYEIVDGQQRLTTLTLLLKSIEKLLPNESRLKTKLQDRILPYNEYKNVANIPRIEIRKKEADLYKNYILQEDKSFLPKEEKRTYTENLFIDNSQFLCDYLVDLKKDEYLPKLAEYILKNIYIVFVKTESFSSSYRLFNVLNTRGLSLSQSDLLKNRLFEIVENEPSIQVNIENYWNEIEKLIGIENMDKFLIIHEISQKSNRNKLVSASKLADIFHNRIKESYNNDAEKFILELKKSAENYQKIKEIDFNPELSKIFRCLVHIMPTEWIPPVLAFLNKLNTKNTVLKEAEFDIFIVNFEKVYLHRWFTKQVKSQREVVCYAVIADINNEKTTKEVIITIKKYRDNCGLNSYFKSDIYLPKSNKTHLTKYVLLRIEEFMQDNSVSKTYHGAITIEHILPQTINDKYWTDRFNKEEHTKWVNKIGNLTLLSGSKNSKAQNSSFDKKIKIYNGSNNKVSFDITKEIIGYKDWGIEELKNRHDKLLQISRKIWFVN